MKLTQQAKTNTAVQFITKKINELEQRGYGQTVIFDYKNILQIIEVQQEIRALIEDYERERRKTIPISEIKEILKL